MEQHTVTPWKVTTDYSNANDCLDIWTDESHGSVMIAEVRGHNREARANAQYIVKACNAHEELVEILRNMVNDTECRCGIATGYVCQNCIGSKALAKLED